MTGNTLQRELTGISKTLLTTSLSERYLRSLVAEEKSKIMQTIEPKSYTCNWTWILRRAVENNILIARLPHFSNSLQSIGQCHHFIIS